MFFDQTAMLDAQRLEALAAAVADGQDPDWSLAEADLDTSQRETLAKLRAIASIGQVFSSLSSDGIRSAPVRAVLVEGDTWGPFRILGHVGRGRFGDVYRAWDPTLAREVALKLIETQESGAGDVVHEGRLMARVHHPNVVSIFGAQRIGPVSGLWMQFVHGQTLAADFARRGSFDAHELVRVGQALCAALNAVHEAGLIHRDVKAQNVLRDDRGQILLGDFGTGRDVDAVPEGGGLAGTPMYVAPELFAGGAASRQSDIYSLGTLLFHLATGDFPVKGRSLAALRDAHTRGERRRLRDARPDLPSRLAAAVDRAIDPNPAHRFPDAGAFATALRPEPARTRRWWLPRPAIVAAAALVLITTALVGRVMWTPAVPTVPFAARDFALVAPFENRTGEPLFDGTLEHAVERELTSSAFVNVVPHIRVQDTLELMRMPPDTRLDRHLAREVAVRDGQIRVLVAGRIEKLGPRYLLSLEAIDPNGGATIVSLTEEARSSDDLLRAIRAVTSRLRVRLGESLPAVTRSMQMLMKATTPSLRALQLLSAGVDRIDSEVAINDPRGAEDLFRKALAEDPGFATAHAYLADVLLHWPEKNDEAIRQARHALTLADQAPDRERWTIRGRAHSVLARRVELSQRGDHRLQFARALETHLQFYPDDTDAWRELAYAYRTLGRFAEAGDVTIRVATMRPTSARAQISAAKAFVERGMIDEASALIQRAHALGVPIERLPPYSGPWLLTFEAQAAWLRGDPAAAWQRVDAVVAGMAPLPSVVREQVELAAVGLYLTLGRLDDADQLLARSLDHVDHDFRRALVLVSRQDLSRLRRFLLDRFTEPQLANRVGSWWIDTGLLDTARVVVARLPDDMWAGQLALAEHRYDAAIAALSRAMVQRQSGGPHWWRVPRKLAEALQRAGRVQEALQVLERAHAERWKSEGGHSGGFEWLRLADALAQLYRRIGRTDDAASVEAELRRLLAVADEDHPIKRRLGQVR